MNDTATEAQRPSVLLVEDDVLLRLVTAEDLRGAGLNVIEASNADEAMTILDSAVPIDLVLTDIRMPGSMDGLALAAFVRQRWPELKIMVASGERPAQAALAVADAFLPKPYDSTAILARLKTLMG
ncbi:MAG: response regulator [Bauldia sp.]|nr:response regulator [Bauldia sp.]MCW5719294.1 response regulator [Bauldia sp.]